VTISIERCRELLGSEADGKTDEQLQHFIDELDSASATFYDQIQEAWKRDPDSVRWFVHAQQTGESE